MKILMLSWEYPPKNVGGLSNHVYYLSQALSKMGHEIHVITCEEGMAPAKENDNGVFVHRVTPYKIDTNDFTKWVMQLNFAMIEEATRIITTCGKFDVIHAHDWLSAFSAKALKCSFKIPTVCTIHATEYGRNGGIRTDMQRYISSTEWMLCYESWKVVACSNYMRHQISDLFSVPWEKIWVIPNGVEPEKFNFEFDWINFRRRYARDEEKIIFYVGRHVFEKGIHLLIEAAQGIVNRYNNAKFIIAGTGPMTEELKNRVRQMGIEEKVLFAGYMSDEDRDKLYRVANAAVFPSLYEPFGIVVLEAMAAGCPVVVSDTGGLGEIVEHRMNGLKTVNGSPESIVDNISQLLYDEELANYLKDNALKSVYENYTWNKVAETTTSMYNWVTEEAKGTEWEVSVEEEVKQSETIKLKDELKNLVKEKLKLELKDDVKKELEEELRDKVEKNLIDRLKHKIEEKLRLELKDKVTNELKERVKSKPKSKPKAKTKTQSKKEALDNITFKNIETVDDNLEIKIDDKSKKVSSSASDTVASVKGKISNKTKEVTEGALDIKEKITSKTKKAAVGLKEGISGIKGKLGKEDEKALDIDDEL